MKPSDWQPIETAPDTGSVLVWCDGYAFEASMVTVGEWEDCDGRGIFDPTHWQPIVGPDDDSA